MSDQGSSNSDSIAAIGALGLGAGAVALSIKAAKATAAKNSAKAAELAKKARAEQIIKNVALGGGAAATVGGAGYLYANRNK